jgi:predicted nucleic acid-binding Zn ribbon protein
MARRGAAASGRQRIRQGEQLLAGLFRRLGLVEQARAWRAMASWARAAGPRLAKHTRAEQLRNKTLVVRVSSSAWANELSFIKAELLAKLRALPGGDVVQDLRFSVGPLGDAPSWEEPAEAKAGRRGGPRHPIPPAIKDGVEGAALAQALDEVADPELRASLARLLGHPHG